MPITLLDAYAGGGRDWSRVHEPLNLFPAAAPQKRHVYPAPLGSMNLRSRPSARICVSWRVQTGAAARLPVYIPEANSRKALGTRIDFMSAQGKWKRTELIFAALPLSQLDTGR